MKVIIDTSSLLSMVRYYLPFDSGKVLFNFIQKNIENEKIVIIDRVLKECKQVSNGTVIKKLNYLQDKKYCKKHGLPIRTIDMLAPSPKKFLNLVDNTFHNKNSKKLSEAEYEERKKSFLETADVGMLVYALNEKQKKTEIAIVTEESLAPNDNKAFHKLPTICKGLQLNVMTLPELLQSYNGIDLEFKGDIHPPALTQNTLF